ncbi:cytochrome b [Roseomonas sp. CCTCC AB2023176]|uniref:cytochrome b n=1 Tax=Roseomonas sp. CCTCC AB2023176 TaxID=3342640 RepID=UPI0035E33543
MSASAQRDLSARVGPRDRYTAVARFLHWVTAALMAVIIILGLTLGWGPELPEATKMLVYNIHESTGLLVLILAIIRLGWRQANPPPPLDPSLPAIQRFAAHANHAGLYVLMIAMPVSGFLATNAWGFPLTWYGLIPVPSPIGRSEAWAPVLQAIHNWSALLIVLFIAVHVTAALHHHLIRRDDTLRRML